MSGRSILHADMATLAGWARNALQWWLGELAELVPARLRQLEGGLTQSFDGATLSPTAKPGARATIVLAPSLCLVRWLERPMIPARDLPRMIELDRDRIMPLPGDRIVVGTRIVTRDLERGRMVVEVAGLGRDAADRLAALIATDGVSPAAILLRRDEGSAINFLPAFRAARLVASRPHASLPWWAVVAALVLLNLGLLVWHDRASVDRLQSNVDQQQPALLVAKTIRERAMRSEQVMQDAAAQRRHHDILTLLAGMSAVLPPDTVIQRLAWKDDTLHLTGFKGKSTNIAAALRRLPFVLDVRSTAPEAVANVPIGEPFDLTVKVGSGR